MGAQRPPVGGGDHPERARTLRRDSWESGRGDRPPPLGAPPPPCFRPLPRAGFRTRRRLEAHRASRLLLHETMILVRAMPRASRRARQASLLSNPGRTGLAGRIAARNVNQDSGPYPTGCRVCTQSRPVGKWPLIDRKGSLTKGRILARNARPSLINRKEPGIESLFGGKTGAPAPRQAEAPWRPGRTSKRQPPPPSAPDQRAMDDTRHRIEVQQRYLQRLHAERPPPPTSLSETSAASTTPNGPEGLSVRARAGGEQGQRQRTGVVALALITLDVQVW